MIVSSFIMHLRNNFDAAYKGMFFTTKKKVNKYVRK